MDAAQDRTITQTQNDNITQEEDLLPFKQEQWITYCALGGLLSFESDSEQRTQDIKQMTISEFSLLTKIPRRTLYYWKESIPNFKQRVRSRRRELFSQSRETILFNRAYLIALTSKDHKAAGEMIKLLLGHFGELELPVQRQQIEAGSNLAELLNQARKKNIIEGEVSGSDDNAGSSPATN